MKMKKYGIALSALACAGMLSCGVLTAQAICKDDDHVWENIDTTPTGRYEGDASGHYEIIDVTYQCFNCPETMEEEESGPLEDHQWTAYDTGDPWGPWFEECDICFYRHNF